MKYFEHWSVIICCLVGMVMFGLGIMSMIVVRDWPAQTPVVETVIQVPTQEPKLVEAPVPIRRAETQIIKEWSGTGAKITESFVIKEQPWGVQWEYNPKTMDGQSVGIFRLCICHANTYGRIGELTNLVTENSGASSINKTGEFRLAISAANTDWTIVVTAPANE